MKKTHVELMNADSLCTAKEELSNSINPNPIKKNLNHTGLYTRGIWYHLVLGQLLLVSISQSVESRAYKCMYIGFYTKKFFLRQ